MSVISCNFTKITAERKRGPAAKMSINAKTGINAVEETTIGKQKALQFSFAHAVTYGPNASVVIEGDVLVLSNEKEAKDTVASFKKNKSFGSELSQKVYNTILTRANIEALILSKELGLPPPFRLPHVTTAKATDAAKAEPKKK